MLPGIKAGYQLFRQQALAEGIAQKGHYDFVASCVALDERNGVLAECLSTTGLADVRQWGDLFTGKASFCVFTHQDWVGWVRDRDDNGTWHDWSQWIEGRYAI